MAAKTTKAAGPKTPRKSSYTDSDILVLPGLDHVRKRPGNYIGGNDSAALSHLLWELIDNAVDEAGEGHAKNVDVIAHADGSWTVIDDGRGIPTGKHQGGKRSTVEVIFSELHAGGKFGTSSYGAAGGLHGVGASVVNALSRRVRVEVSTRTTVHRLDFINQTAGQYDDKTDKFTAGHAMKRVGKPAHGHSGTSVRFWPDMELFTADARIAWDEVVDRLRRTAWLVKGVKFTITDESGEHEPEVAVAENGVLDALETLAEGVSFIGKPIMCEGKHVFPEKVSDHKTKKVVTVERECRVEVAMQWTEGHDSPVLVSFVNTIPTPEGGTHLDGFEDGVAREVRLQLQGAGLRKMSKFKDAAISRDDCLSGLVAVVRVILPEPQFRSQTKRQLGTQDAERIVKETVRASLSDWFSGKAKGSTKQIVRQVLDHVADAVIERHRIATEAAAHRKARKAHNGSLPAKLVDCRNHPGGELLIVEGDSAAGPAKRARDINFQAVLPLRGKVINAESQTAAQVTANAEVAALVAAIGAGSGKDFDISAARYDRIVLLADADVDGSHIRCLLLTLLWHRMRPMLEEGRVFAAQPPTHAVTVVSSGDKTFVHTEAELDKKCKALDRRNRKYRVTRFKGLGEMNDDELAATTLDPTTRVLRQVSVKDAKSTAAALDVLMGKDPDRRKDFIFANSAEHGYLLDV